ncbi:MAG: hypothetical protein RQM92_04925 [Candidatus Syntrophopropionicum ammoniitolerans]
MLADPGKSDVWIEDASIAALTIQLVAHSLGLGYTGHRLGKG